MEFILKKKKNILVIVNNLNKNKIYLEKKRLKFTNISHNYQNLLACYASHYLLKEKEPFLKSVYQLKNLEHRLEHLIKIKNISIFNDSKSTNINSAKKCYQIIALFVLLDFRW